MIYITTAATTTIASKAYGILVAINKATTGTLTIIDGSTTVAVIAASTAAQDKRYYGFNGVISITNGSTEDVTVSVLNHQGT